MSAVPTPVRRCGLTEAQLIDIERLFEKLAQKAGVVEREDRNIRMSPEFAGEISRAIERLTVEIRELWGQIEDIQEPEADL
jgi:hypothetical protein